VRWIVCATVALTLAWITRAAAGGRWTEAAFDAHHLVAVPLPPGRDAIIGSPTTFTTEKGDTLLDIGRWYGLSAREISDANGHIDWWAPPPDRQIILPTERILPEGPRVGIVMNIPEMRIYYYYPPTGVAHRGKLSTAAYHGGPARVVFTFPVGLGRFDWKTPVGSWRVTGKLLNPTWVVPKDIYEEHLERDGEAQHVIPGGEADNPLGHYKLVLSLPEYGIHGTDVPWGVGMNVSHGCIRLYPENIQQLYGMVPVGTPGRFVYQPIKFGWQGDRLYVEVHDDLYGVYPGLWNHALHEVTRLGLGSSVDMRKLQAAVEAKTGLPTDVSPGEAPAGVETASTATAPDTMAPVDTGAPSAESAAPPSAGSTGTDVNATDSSNAPAADDDSAGDTALSPATAVDSTPAGNESGTPAGDDAKGLPTTHITTDNSVE
jgi:L,D-transpeptidase ErfK/SrfK